MKKRIVMAIFALALFLSAVPSPCFAAEAPDDSYIIWEDDGSYIEITYSILDTRASGTKTGTKTYKYHRSDGAVLWEAALTGTFTYDAAASNCTSCTCAVTVYNDAWYLVSKSTSRNEDTAYAEVTMGYKVLDVTITKRTYNFSLTCDKNGNLS